MSDIEAAAKAQSPQGLSEDDATFLAACQPKLDRLEGLRLKKFASLNRRKKLALPIGAVVTPVLGFIDYWLILLQRGNDDGFVGVTIGGLVLLWWWVTVPQRQYARAYKAEILPEITRLFGEFDYAPKGKIPMEAMKPSRIVPSHTRYSAEDHFSGRYRGVGIAFSEIVLKRKSGRSTTTVFKGLAILLTYDAQKFHGHTILTRDRGAIGEWLQAKTAKLERADLTDPEFEKRFDVFTSDQVEARYLIDPAIVENIKALHAEFEGKDFRAAFFEDRVLVLIASSKNHFEPAAIDQPAYDAAGVLSMKREVGQILSIVDRLALYDWRALAGPATLDEHRQETGG